MDILSTWLGFFYAVDIFWLQNIHNGIICRSALVRVILFFSSQNLVGIARFANRLLMLFACLDRIEALRWPVRHMTVDKGRRALRANLFAYTTAALAVIGNFAHVYLRPADSCASFFWNFEPPSPEVPDMNTATSSPFCRLFNVYHVGHLSRHRTTAFWPAHFSVIFTLAGTPLMNWNPTGTRRYASVAPNSTFPVCNLATTETALNRYSILCLNTPSIPQIAYQRIALFSSILDSLIAVATLYMLRLFLTAHRSHTGQARQPSERLLLISVISRSAHRIPSRTPQRQATLVVTLRI